MEDNILVTILFVIVSILLIVDIMIAVTIYKIVKRLQHLVTKADEVTDNIAKVSKAAVDMQAAKAVASLVKKATSTFKDKKTNAKKNKK